MFRIRTTIIRRRFFVMEKIHNFEETKSYIILVLHKLSHQAVYVFCFMYTTLQKFIMISREAFKNRGGGENLCIKIMPIGGKRVFLWKNCKDL